MIQASAQLIREIEARCGWLPGWPRIKVQVAISGGRTSAFMAIWLKTNLSHMFEFLFTFANTSREHEDTLRFLDAVDQHFGLGVVWLEAVVHTKRKGKRGVACTSRVTNYADAKRDGSVFEAVVAKYGLPNATFLHCTREMKKNPMDHYAELAGFGNALVAIGIRADEKRRVSKGAAKNRIIYPLIDMIPTTKLDVLDFFEQFDWNLQIEEFEGNCVDCQKKSDRKLQAAYKKTPEIFEWRINLEDLYKHVGPNNVPGPRKIVARLSRHPRTDRRNRGRAIPQTRSH